MQCPSPIDQYYILTYINQTYFLTKSDNIKILMPFPSANTTQSSGTLFPRNFDIPNFYLQNKEMNEEMEGKLAILEGNFDWIPKKMQIFYQPWKVPSLQSTHFHYSWKTLGKKITWLEIFATISSLLPKYLLWQVASSISF